MDELPRRRGAGFVVIALAMIVGSLLFGYVTSRCQAPGAQPSPPAAPQPARTIVAATLPPPDEPGPTIQVPPPIR